MECLKCKEIMYKAKLIGYLSSDVYLTNIRKGFMESEKRSKVSCFVCPKCGYIELKADAPQAINNI